MKTFIQSLYDLVGSQLLEYGSIGIQEIVLEQKMYDRVFHEISTRMLQEPIPYSGDQIPYSDWFFWQFTKGQIKVSKAIG